MTLNWDRSLQDLQSVRGGGGQATWYSMRSRTVADCSECGKAIQELGRCVANGGDGTDCDSGSSHRYITWKCRGLSCRVAERTRRRRQRIRARKASVSR